MRMLLAAVCLAAAPLSAAAQGSATAPAQAKPAAPAAATAPAPAFPTATVVAYMDPELVFARTAEGKRLIAGVQTFRDKKLAELGDKNKQLQALQAKRQQSAGVMGAAALASLDRDIQRLTVELDRASQDAEGEYNEQLAQAQGEFKRKLQPVVEKSLKDHGAHVLLVPGGGVSWVDRSIDLTDDLVARMEVAYPATGTPAKPK